MAAPLLLGTNNAHKVDEFRRMLEPESFVTLAPRDVDLNLEVPETGDTFDANARLKAEAFCNANGLVCLADDSGLVVDALGGAPGILSARYGGPEADDQRRNELVLDQLRDVEKLRRTARFVAVIAVAVSNGETRTFAGTVEGRIAQAAGGTHGFGYDPIFFYPPYGATLASVDRAMKDAVSHRGQAMREALVYLRWLRSEGILA